MASPKSFQTLVQLKHKQGTLFEVARDSIKLPKWFHAEYLDEPKSVYVEPWLLETMFGKNGEYIPHVECVTHTLIHVNLWDPQEDAEILIFGPPDLQKDVFQMISNLVDYFYKEAKESEYGWREAQKAVILSAPSEVREAATQLAPVEGREAATQTVLLEVREVAVQLAPVEGREAATHTVLLDVREAAVQASLTGVGEAATQQSLVEVLEAATQQSPVKVGEAVTQKSLVEVRNDATQLAPVEVDEAASQSRFPASKCQSSYPQVLQSNLRDRVNWTCTVPPGGRWPQAFSFQTWPTFQPFGP
ncbi:KH domain-containing protein 3-like [Acomys russatus]|uniref:KH domain-containing protein 3-like n=1 Tax=Acomys russatus TaxID=60746 RepID=UPI0021E32306|nr:KH domain-containing protein 3-like [Acomys russatus]